MGKHDRVKAAVWEGKPTVKKTYRRKVRMNEEQTEWAKNYRGVVGPLSPEVEAASVEELLERGWGSVSRWQIPADFRERYGPGVRISLPRTPKYDFTPGVRSQLGDV